MEELMDQQPTMPKINNNITVNVEQKGTDAAQAATLLDKLTEQALDRVVAKLSIDLPDNDIRAEGYVCNDHRMEQLYVLLICKINGQQHKFTVPFDRQNFGAAVGQIRDKLAQVVATTILRTSMDKMATALAQTCGR